MIWLLCYLASGIATTAVAWLSDFDPMFTDDLSASSGVVLLAILAWPLPLVCMIGELAINIVDRLFGEK